jgi:SAM-dependent methyltransferase
MNPKYSRLVAPNSGETLSWEEHSCQSQSGTIYEISGDIPRFVSSDNYAQAFGSQWVKFPKTQLDSATGIPLSSDRLARCLGENLETLEGKLVLEAGSGAGRFTEILLAHGATVDSFDFSKAVSANLLNNGSHPNLCLVQADIRSMPFPTSTYDLVLCLGVVQHTPNSEESIKALWSRVRPGGMLVFDHYRRKVRNYLPPPIGVGNMAYRRYFLRLPEEQQFEAVKRTFDRWFPLIWRFRDSKAIQFALSRISPIVNYYPHFGLRDKDMYYEWMLLDTHDAMTDVYKHRRTAREISQLLTSLGAVDINVSHGGNGIEASCKKPA